ncbi:MAG TPA: methyltransferase domain-containing protein [Vicinamibacterales bacterium]|nr:methyltransferase domain-containing protein [Vicinamibacterales bacterium]
MTDASDSRGREQPASDCWGRLNEVEDLAPILTILDALPEGFGEARRTLLRHLGLRATSHVLEAGSGPGTALPDLVEHVGPEGRIVGIDPTRALVAQASERARATGASQATYDVGDIRRIPFPDGAFDAAFCDKILVHVSPVSQAIAELARVTRRGGRVGAVEWFAQGMVLAADYAVTRQVLDGSAPAGALNPMTPLELESHFATAGLESIESGTIVAESRQFLPSLRIMLERRVQQATDLGALTADAGAAWLRDLETRAAHGRFYWAALVRWAAGVKHEARS